MPPSPDDPRLYANAQELIKNHKAEYWITGVTVTTIWETAWALRGLERMMTDLIENPELADRILDNPTIAPNSRQEAGGNGGV